MEPEEVARMVRADPECLGEITLAQQIPGDRDGGRRQQAVILLAPLYESADLVRVEQVRVWDVRGTVQVRASVAL